MPNITAVTLSDGTVVNTFPGPVDGRLVARAFTELHEQAEQLRTMTQSPASASFVAPSQEDWKQAFEEARAQALNVDAFTFQIAWAYAIASRSTAPTTGSAPIGYISQMDIDDLNAYAHIAILTKAASENQNIPVYLAAPTSPVASAPDAVRQCIGMLSSAIRCGEEFGPSHQAMIDAAFSCFTAHALSAAVCMTCPKQSTADSCCKYPQPCETVAAPGSPVASVLPAIRDALNVAYAEGWAASGEGYNYEYPGRNFNSVNWEAKRNLAIDHLVNQIAASMGDKS